jgi:hypothetical protein
MPGSPGICQKSNFSRRSHMSKILVQSKPERFRRAGIEFNRAGVELDTDELKKDQLEAIKSEPMLSVSEAKGKKDK